MVDLPDGAVDRAVEAVVVRGREAEDRECAVVERLCLVRAGWQVKQVRDVESGPFDPGGTAVVSTRKAGDEKARTRTPWRGLRTGTRSAGSPPRCTRPAGCLGLARCVRRAAASCRRGRFASLVRVGAGIALTS